MNKRHSRRHQYASKESYVKTMEKVDENKEIVEVHDEENVIGYVLQRCPKCQNSLMRAYSYVVPNHKKRLVSSKGEYLDQEDKNAQYLHLICACC